MATQNEVLVRFRAETRQFVADTQKIVDQIRAINQALAQRGQTGILADTDLKAIAADAQRGAERIRQLTSQLELLERIRARGAGSRRHIPISAEEATQAGLERSPGTGGVARTQISERQAEVEGQINQLLTQRQQQEAQLEQIARTQLGVSREQLNVSTQRQFLEEKSAQILSGEFQSQLLESRIQALQRVHDQLVATREEIRRQVSQQVGRQAGGRIDRDIEQAEVRRAAAVRDREKLTRQIAATEKQLADQNIRGTQRQIEVEARLAELRQRRATAVAAERRATDDLQSARARQQAAVEATGATQAIDEINQEIAKVEDQLVQAGRQGVASFAPELKKLQQQLLANQKITERTAALDRERVQLIQQIRQLQSQVEDDLPTATTPEAFRERQLAQLPRLERTLFTAFDDVGRRFRTALQFALSGAVIFAAQRLVREFIDAAVEVERAFADIESALEFDLADEGLQRGSAAFNKQVESIRRNVLQLANDFNILPAEGNEAAFKMVARFEDSEQAMQAVRAQFLATTIATISQDEAIRALSATAEGFADVVLDSNSSLTLQERLLERERIAAEGYAAALDEAVLIQQRFGVEVEDTLEGTARAAQTFSQLGFSRQQTEAIVGAVSRELGQTGTNVAERLNRAFAELTAPETRDKLLELAGASDDLNLSLEDFASGADLISALDRQFAELEQRSPEVANRLVNILGQRRETEVIATLFGTTDLRRAIEASLSGAAGAAERRFSFLAVTIDERIQSIVSNFQALAQNFERLELFGPVKVFLAGIDSALEAVNTLLQYLQNVVQFLDDIGSALDLKIGTTLKNIVVTALSLLTILRATAATITVIGVTRAGIQQAQAVATGQAAAGATGGLFAALAPVIGNLTNSAKEAGGGFRGLVAASRTLAGALAAAARAAATWTGNMLLSVPGVSRMASAAGLSAAALGGLTLGLGAAVFAIADFVSEGSKAIQALKDFQNIPQEAELETRRREVTEGEFETPEAREVFRLQQELDRTIRGSEQNVRGFFSTLTTRLFPVLDKSTRDSIGLFEALTQQAGTAARITTGNFSGLLDEELVPLSEAWWQAQIEAAEKTFRQAQLDEVSASIQRLRTSGFGDPLGPTVPQISTTPGLDLIQDQTPLDRLIRDYNAAVKAFETAETPEERTAAVLAIENLLVTHEDVLAELGQTYEAMEVSTRELLEKAGNLQNQLRLGQVSESLAPDEFFRISEQLRVHAKELEQALGTQTPENQELIDSVLEAADDAFLQAIQARRASFERQRGRAGLIQEPALRLRAELQVFEQELQFLLDQGFGRGSTAVLDVMDQIAQTQAELASATQNRAREMAQHRVSMARTLEEWVAAQEELIDAIAQSIRFIEIPLPFGGSLPLPAPGEFDRIAREMEEVRRSITERLEEEAVTVAEAQTRLAGPINSRLQQIAARIKGLRTRIAQGFFSQGEALQAQVELAELLAQRVEAEAEAAAAWVRLQAGVGDSIRQTQAEMTIVARQLEITANLYGEQSAQYLQLKLKQEQLRNSLINAELELEDLNRRLGSDITSDFEQAQLDLIEIMRQLSELDLGELERARLELEKKQAEAAAEKAFFDDRLFNLRFDFETGEIGMSAYIASLEKLLEGVDTSTQQGKEIFLQITNLIESLTDDVSEMQFNIPSSIRLPTIFEVRRALAADQLGVNYMDNRQQNVTLEIANTVELEEAFAVLDNYLGSSSKLQFARQATGGATITPGGF